jgi:hypothetical protein
LDFRIRQRVRSKPVRAFVILAASNLLYEQAVWEQQQCWPFLCHGSPTSTQSVHHNWTYGVQVCKSDKEATAMCKLIPITGTMCEYKITSTRSTTQKFITALKTLARDYFIAIGVRHV